MAENVLWYAKNFPDEKFLMWFANYHGTKDISQTLFKSDSLFYFDFQSMGEALYNELGPKLYSLATIHCPAPMGDSVKGKFEVELMRTTPKGEAAFVDFEPLRYAEGYRDQSFECEAIMRKDGRWLHIFDGVYCF